MIFDSKSNNPNTIGYYIVNIATLMIAYIAVIIITKFIKNKKITDGSERKDEFDIDKLTEEQRSLRVKFLLVTTTVKAAVWVKAPYIFALYNRLHGFDRGDIGILYAIDNFSALIMGPILGSLGDIYGRKKFCFLYCVLVTSHIFLRLTGSQILAYFAQFLTGIAGALIETAFESWLNFEATILFSNDRNGRKKKNNFLKEIFSKQVTIDCFTSIILTTFASILYLNFGLLYPFYACLFFIILSGFVILIFWRENDINKLRMLGGKEFEDICNNTFCEKIQYSWECLKEDKALFSLGIIESCFKISLQLFVFIWTPLLEETAGGLIHPGSVFVCFMIARLMGGELFELFKITLGSNSYLVLIFITSTACLSFFIDYSFAIFNVRFFMLIYFDGLNGTFNPLLSSLKAEMIPEKIRTTLMNFFRIPINVFSILSLILTNYVTTYQICLVAFFFMLVGTFVNVYLLYIHEPPDQVKDNYVAVQTSHLKHHQHASISKESENHDVVDSLIPLNNNGY